VKVPATPPAAFIINPEHLRAFQAPLWRVFNSAGDHPSEWDELRHFGPLEEMRFDPQPLPKADYSDIGVMYTATDSYTAIGESFQHTRVIDRSLGGKTIAAWDPIRELTLLDLTSNWPVVNSAAAAAMMTDDKKATQAWAQAIDARHGSTLDGLYHVSSINFQPMVTLFSRTERIPAFPRRPRFSALLSDTGADEIVARAKKKLGYTSL
jgi:hypothetical protein